MARYATLFGVILLVVALAGCGGGKGVTTTASPTPQPSGNSRLMQPGDDLRYEITGKHYDGWHSWDVTGSFTQTVLAETVTVPASTVTSAAGQYTAPTDVVGNGSVTITRLGAPASTVTLTAPANTLQDLRDAVNAIGGLQASIENTGNTTNPDLRLTIETTTPTDVATRIRAIDVSGLTGGTAPSYTFTQASVVQASVVMDTLVAEVKINKDDGSLYITVVDGIPKSLEEKITKSERYYVTQDADGTLWTYGGVNTEGTVYWITEPDIRYPLLASPLTIGNGWWSAHVKQSDSVEFDPSFVVTTSENTSVPAGTFKTHRIRGTGKIAGMKGDIDIWWSPDSGGPVQFSVLTTDYIPTSLFYSSRTFTLTFKLTGKSRGS